MTAASKIKVACVQVNASGDMAENIEAVSALVRQAAAEGAELILTPENVVLMDLRRSTAFKEGGLTEERHAGYHAFKALAKELGVWLMAGSLGIVVEEGKRIANRCYVFSPDGEVAAQYDKIHMFDVDLPGGESYRESDSYRPGEEAVLVDLPWGKLGLSICYDLRFPHLFRNLAQAGATMLSVPAAFTKVTGQAHWHTLLRARAIENGCYVFAPGQVGSHPGDRETYGHSLIIDPWGKIIADAEEKVGYILAEIDLHLVDEVRGRIPSLNHDRLYAQP